MSPKSNTGVLKKRKRFGVTEGHKEEGHVMTEAEIGVMLPLAKNTKDYEPPARKRK